MLLSRLLLLFVVASEMWGADSKPIQFVCDEAARKALNVAPEMKNALIHCNDSNSLLTPVELPCTELHVATWKNTTDQEKRGDIVASLRLLIRGVKAAKAARQAGCEASLLHRLENNINNYLLILARLQLSGSVVSPLSACAPRSTNSLETVLQSFDRLVSVKVERFVTSLKAACPPR